MEYQNLLSYNTHLNDKTLWADGSYSFTKNQLIDYFLSGFSDLDNVFVEEMDEDVEFFNKQTGKNICVKYKNDLKTPQWNIPEYYKTLDVYDYIAKKAYLYIKNNSVDKNTILDRINYELQKFIENDKLDLIRVVIYIVETMRKNDLVWGVGRGSSCACFLFYLIGLHSVDCIKYDVPFDEFFR
jgi:DNA polymerase III alpha subunit